MSTVSWVIVAFFVAWVLWKLTAPSIAVMWSYKRPIARGFVRGVWRGVHVGLGFDDPASRNQ